MSSVFSLDDFKLWMQAQSGFATEIPRARFVGLSVDPCIPRKKLAPRMCVREGSLEELVVDFSKHGGKVVEIDGKHLVVEVRSGSFSIPECCVRRR